MGYTRWRSLTHVCVLFSAGLAALVVGCTEVPENDGVLEPYINDDHLPVGSWEEDSAAVRAILDANGLHAVAVNDAVTMRELVPGVVRVVVLGLPVTGISTLPVEVQALTALERIDLSGNSLTEIPASVGALQRLEELNLSDNQLSFVPTDLGNLGRLCALRVGNNQLTGIPAVIAQIPTLETIDFHQNQLSGLPGEFIDHPNISTVNVNDNQICLAPTDPLAQWLSRFDSNWHNTQTCP